MIYRIPLQERETFLNGAQTFGKRKTMCVDGIGFTVQFHSEQEHLITPKYMRRFLMQRRNTHCLIRARSVKDALDIFYSEWERKGDDRKPTHKNLWIETKHGQYIEELFCSEIRMREEPRFEVKCGGFSSWYAGCVLDSYDAEESYCPIMRYANRYHDLEKAGKLPIHHVRGFRLVRMRDILTPAEMVYGEIVPTKG